jgi:6-phosphofructokinase 1
VARHIEQFQIQGLLIIGGMAAYETAEMLRSQEDNYPSFGIPVICVPATIDNNLPGTDLAIGTDTALNSIVEVLDKIKQSAVASQRCFIVEVMGRQCGYLALMAALASGAEQVYLPEEGINIQRLLADLQSFTAGFRQGRRVGLAIRNECANPLYTTQFIANLFEEEGRADFDVRQAILGHLQQGGDPTAFDRTLAVRFAAQACRKLVDMLDKGESASLGIGLHSGQTGFTDLRDLKRMISPAGERPRDQWWLPLLSLMQQLADKDSGVPG